jgi:hypothetical protein
MVDAKTEIGRVQWTLKIFTAVLSLGLSLVLVIGGLTIWFLTIWGGRTSSWVWNRGIAILVVAVGLVLGGIAFHFWRRRNSSWTLTQIISASFLVVVSVGLFCLLRVILMWPPNS